LISNDRFATCSYDEIIKLFYLNTYECIRTFIEHEGIVYCNEKFLNDKIKCCSRDKTIRMWDLNTCKCLKILRGHSNSVSSIRVFSNDKIVSGSYSENQSLGY
jgi:WD40 repeat protein